MDCERDGKGEKGREKSLHRTHMTMQLVELGVREICVARNNKQERRGKCSCGCGGKRSGCSREVLIKTKRLRKGDEGGKKERERIPVVRSDEGTGLSKARANDSSPLFPLFCVGRRRRNYQTKTPFVTQRFPLRPLPPALSTISLLDP